MAAEWNGERQAKRVELAGAPKRLPEIFAGLAAAGAPVSALFGGAARDADLGALWGEERRIKDYDLRCWLDPALMKDSAWEARFGAALLAAFPGAELDMEPSLGTGRMRHIVRWDGIELDISARPRPRPDASPQDCAIDRALDSDASLSAVAIASDLSAWCEALYLDDRQNKTLSFYPGVEPNRLASYSQRMIGKFPSATPRFLEAPGVARPRAPKA